MNRVAHEVSAHHGSFGQKIFEVFVAETGQPRPQPYVGREGGLGLQAGQVADRGQGGLLSPAQQELAGQGGPVELELVEAVHGSA